MTTSPDVSMEAADHGRGGGAGLLAVAAAPAPVLMMHERKLSQSYSFSSAAASLSSPASSTSSRSYHAAMSGKSLSCESIPVVPAEAEMEKQSSLSSSASSYESFFQLEAADLDRITAAATRAPAVQTMMASHEQQQLPVAGGGGGGYDPRRLPSSMFRTGSTSPGGGGDMVDWSVTSNDSLFSINLRHSGDLSARYTNSNHSGDLFYDASGGGFHRLPSAAAAAAAAGGGGGGGLCVSESCAKCTIAAGKNRKSVRFASDAEIVSGEITNPSAVFPTLADAMGEEPAAAAATEGKETAKSPDAAAQGGWCLFRCCWPSPPSVWWPRCGCGRGGVGCGVFCCGEYCRC